MLGAPRGVITALALALDLFLVANLLYFRTYYTVIPLDSYRLTANLQDFTDSILSSLRRPDLLFPLLTLTTALAVRHYPRLRTKRRDRLRYMGLLLLTGAVTYSLTLFKGGFRRSYEAMLVHRQLSATPTYSVFGSLSYEALREKVAPTPELMAEIGDFLTRAPAAPLNDTITPRRNVVVILAESFESWVLEREVEGTEITPCLNRLLEEEHVLYAPYVQTQVKGGRSIDAQLLLTAGLLPVEDGCYSARYPHSAYPSLVKAFRQKHPAARTCLLTPDKETVWNQMIVAREFGFDTLISHKDFREDVQTGSGSRRRLCDGAFFNQCLEKFRQQNLLPQDGSAPLYIQCVTYSGHHPFVLPEKLRRVRFSEALPDRMRHYLMTANYTDRAIGAFVDSLRRLPAFDDTMIVITGDHEGLASDRAALAADPAGRGIVCEGRFTPLIVLNAPVAMRYEAVIGQIDLYPTLRDLLGLEQYYWPGLGQSILRAPAPRAATDQRFRIIGDAANPGGASTGRLKRAWTVSDRMIRSDYFRSTGREK